MDTMRMESGFLHWGHDISPDENQYQAGLNFAISYKKPFEFIGKEQLLKIKKQKQDKRFAMLFLKNSQPGNPLLLNEEPIYLNNKITNIKHTENKITQIEINNKNKSSYFSI